MTARRAHGEGTIYYEESRDRWVGEITIASHPLTGKRRRRKATGKTRKAVAERLKAIQQSASTEAPPTIVALYEPWIERKAETVTPSTARMYRDLWAGHVGPVFGSRQVNGITVMEVEAFLAARKHLAKATLRKIRGLLSQVIDEAIRHRIVEFNAARVAALPAGVRKATRSRALTADETADLLTAAAGHRLEPWLIFALHTGARPGEIASLTWDNLDLDDRTVSITASKTGTHRTLRFPEHVVGVLRTHRKRLIEERLLMGDQWPENNLVFISESGTALDTANLRRFLLHMSREAGLDWAPTGYTLRHTHASLLSDTGIHAEALAHRLGHKDSRTTTQYYIHPVSPVVEAGADLDLSKRAI